MRSISFIHAGSPLMASYRYRAAMPAKALDATMNDYNADVIVFSKPQASELKEARDLASQGAYIIVDICDDHFNQQHYHEFLSIADKIACPTKFMQKLIEEYGRDDAVIIEDPYEFPELDPHCGGVQCLWFGHGSNIPSLMRVMPSLRGVPVSIVSNVPGTIPWSMETLGNELAACDIVLLPATKVYKSPNRAVEAIRSGCFVVAEPHPAWADFPIWQGDIREGIEWARKHPNRANQMTLVAQDFIRERFSPETLAYAWKKLLASASISVAERSVGLDGWAWIH